MTESEFQGLKYGDRIRVRRPGAKRAQLAVVTRATTPVGRFFLVDFAWVLRDTGVGTETLRSGYHVAIFGQDDVQMDAQQEARMEGANK